MTLVDVVISGIGCRLPNSQNVKEFSDNLLTGKSMLRTIDRWPPGKIGTPEKAGLVDGFDKFDYTFFGVNYELGLRTVPQTRTAIETAFEALIDAGINPTSVRGSNAQVYAGTMQSENESLYAERELSKRSGYHIMGLNRCMSANRISYYFNLTGSSVAYDGASAWLGLGLARARQAIQSGECDTVFINSSAALFAAEFTKQRQLMGLVSSDSKCRPYDVDASGVARGDAQVTFLIQRADIAKRSYGSIVFAGSESQGTLPNWLLSLDKNKFRSFLDSSYRDSRTDPNQIKILEADGLAIKDIVEVEMNVLDEVLNQKRPDNCPLYVGTVKSVVGDSDAASGFTALTKLILAMETGIISPTLDCKNINPNIRGLTEGRMEVVTKPTEWHVTPDTHVAVSTLSVGGLISHVVLKAHGKTTDKNVKNDHPYPYLVVMSGRTQEYAKDSLQLVASSPFDPEYIRLTQEVFAAHIENFEYRGYGFHGHVESQNFAVQRYNRRPVWFVYSGMGSQWTGMGRELLLIPTIRQTFERLHKILEPKGIDLLTILTSNSETFSNILHSFVGIAAVQIALTNVLRQLGIVPEGLIGHSVGELGCSYADECLTEEQTILASYERGMATLKAELIPGLMAAVGLGYKEAKNLLPPDVYVACRNSRESCTISGPTESVNRVIASFKDKGIFVRGVNVSNIAYHSPYIQPAAPFLYESLRKIIPSPKERSPKWVCTSAPMENWNSDEVRFCSAEYHTNNLLGAVLFEDGSAHIPKNALVIEIAPHGLLQAILKRSLSDDVANVPLTRRGASSAVEFLLEAIGKLFLEGQSPKIWHLYPDVKMPVSRSTPSLGPLVKWDHKEIFPLPNFASLGISESSTYQLDDTSSSIEIGNFKCLPAAYALVIAYNRLTKMTRALTSLQVIFEDVHFYDLIKLELTEVAELLVAILPKLGVFHITKDDTLVVKGKIRVIDRNGYEAKKIPNIEGKVECSLNSDDVYSELETRGVVVPEKMKNIQNLEIRQHDSVANVLFDEDWGSIVNSLIFLLQLRSDSNLDQKSASVSHIQRLIIDPVLKNMNDTTARFHLPSGTVEYPGIWMTGVEFRTVDTATETLPVALRFVPFGQSGLKDDIHFLSSVLQLNSHKRLQNTSIVKICDVDGEFTSITDKLQDMLKSNFDLTPTPKNADLLVCGPSSVRAMASTLASSNSFVLTRCGRSDRNKLDDTLKETGLHIIEESDASGNTNPLLAITCRLPPLQPSDCKVVKMKPEDPLPAYVDDTHHNLIIFVWENDTFQPVEKLLSDVKRIGCKRQIRLVLLMTPNAPPFSVSLPLYSNQLRLNVPLNIYFNGKWGDYYLLEIPEPWHLGQNKQKHLLIEPDIALKERDCNIIILKKSSIKIHEISDHKKVLPTAKKTITYCAKCSAPGNIIGVATWDDKFSYFVPDPDLFWTVNEEWCSAKAAPVLFSYAMAYYMLFNIANLKIRQSILISCPLTPLGQAVIHIANSLNCDIIILVSSVQEEERVRHLFPKLSARTILSPTALFSISLKKRYPQGFHVIVSDLTGSRLRASTECLHKLGTILQVEGAAMLNPDYIGLNFFLSGALKKVHGVTQRALMNSSLKVKRLVQQWVRDGLESGVAVPGIWKGEPSLNGHAVNGSRTLSHNICEKINGHDNKEGERIESCSKPIPKRRKRAFIIGGSKAQWVRLSYLLAKKGYKIVTLIQENPSPNLVTFHSKILHREFDMELENLTVRSGADLIKPELGNLKSILVFGNNTFAEDVVRELDAKGMKDVRLIFFSKQSAYFSRMCERWSQNGLKVRAVLGVEDAPTSGATLDWLLSPGASTVCVLNKEAFVGYEVDTISLSESGILPTSASELQALGSAIKKHTSPIFVELVTRGRNLSQNGEVQPLFFITGLHRNATSDLEALATSLLAPLVEVTLPADCGSLEATANAVIQGIRRIQSTGPYNLSGDTIRSDVVIKVARMLEEKGSASVIFLMNEQIGRIRNSLVVSHKFNKLGYSVLQAALSDTIEPRARKNINLDNLPWSKQVQTAVSQIPSLNAKHRDDIEVGLHHIYSSVRHILESRDEAVLVHGIVHLLWKGKEYRKIKLSNRCYKHIIPSTKLNRNENTDIFSPYLATHVLQLELDKIRKK